MSCWGGQVQDNIDFRICDQFLSTGICFRDLELSRFHLRLRFVQAAAGASNNFDHFIFFQICDVNFADVAKTDDANFEDLYE
jgi:hypothetical protein